MFFKPLGDNSPLEIRQQCAEIYVQELKSRDYRGTISSPLEYWNTASRFLMNYYVSDESSVLAIGCFSTDKQTDIAMLHNIIVRESERREERRGIGRFLVERLEFEIKALGLKRVELTSTPEAQTFYERLEYRRDDPTSNFFYKLLNED